MNSQASNPTSPIFWILALVLGFLGICFIGAASQGNAVVRVPIGLVFLVCAGALIYLARTRTVQYTHIHKMELDLPAEVNAKGFQCTSCGATLDSKSVTLVAGAVHINCSYCGASYQLEEDAKW